MDEAEIALLKSYVCLLFLFYSLINSNVIFCFFLKGTGPYDKQLKKNEDDVQAILKRVNELAGIKESDTGLAPPALWDLAADKQILSGYCHS